MPKPAHPFAKASGLTGSLILQLPHDVVQGSMMHIFLIAIRDWPTDDRCEMVIRPEEYGLACIRVTLASSLDQFIRDHALILLSPSVMR